MGGDPGRDNVTLMPSIAAFFFIALPWLNPWAPGPSPAVMPWVLTLVSFAFVLLLAPRVRLAEVAPAAWLFAALLSSLLGLLQYFGATAALGAWVNSTGIGEAYANLRQRNQFATLTNIGLAVLLWWGVKQPLARTSLVGAAVLLALGNAASSSRTGLLQLGLLVALVWLWRRPALGQQRPAIGPLTVLTIAVLTYGLGAWALPFLAHLDPNATGIFARLQADSPSCASRLTLWGNVLHLIAQKPMWGWGWGELDYAHFITLYPGARFCDILDNAHNLPLHLAVELGVPLALAICGVGVWALWRAQPWRETNATRQMAWAVLGVILTHSLLEYPLWYGPFQVAFGLCVWLLWRAPASSFLGRRVCVWAVALALSLVVFSGYVAWDYQRISQPFRVPAQRWEAYRADPLKQIGDSWLFQGQLQFAELTTTALTPDNAAQQHALALTTLHFSPEPRVIELLIESAELLGHHDNVLFYRARYQAAFSTAYAAWVARKSK